MLEKAHGGEDDSAVVFMFVCVAYARDFRKYRPCVVASVIDQNNESLTCLTYGDGESSDFVPRVKCYQLGLERSEGCDDRCDIVLRTCYAKDCGIREIEERQMKWLCVNVVPKILQWSDEGGGKGLCGGRGGNRPAIAEIDGVRYVSLYNEMKDKYAQKIQAIWTESTDPKSLSMRMLPLRRISFVSGRERRLKKDLKRSRRLLILAVGMAFWCIF